MSAWEMTASPIHDGPTMSVRMARESGPAGTGMGRLMGGRAFADQLVERPAIVEARLPPRLDRQEDPRMRVPQLLRGERAVQRQVRRRHVDELLVKLGR